jgi:thiol-disulfide isomerase/thioredoxin
MSDFDAPQPRRSATGQFVFWGALALAVVGVIWLRQGAGRGNQGHKHAAVGRPLTELNLRGLTGGASDIDLKELHGKVALVNFWGTWCPPCRYELPHIAQLRHDFAAREDFRLLAVSCPAGAGESLDELRQQTQEFLASKKLELPTYADPGASTQQSVAMTLGDLENFGLPTTLLLDRQGIIRAVWIGYDSGVEVDMRQAIETELAKK